jgi:ATPase subunit of ABC transporter with duplicated ATPase domains
MSLLTATQLVKSYNRRRVVDEVSFQIDAGEIVGLLGRNGAGKTTSFRMTIGMITPEAGQGDVPGRRHHGDADVQARPRRHRLPQPGAERLPAAHRRAEPAGDSRDPAAQQGGPAQAPPPNCSTSSP